MKVLISACLAGITCRYDAAPVTLSSLDALREKHELIPFCPEVWGGLSTPREPCEIRDGRVYTRSGGDVTEQFVRGAEEAVRLARLHGCACALLKERSPSCGCGRIYDGTFSGTLVEGNGVCAQRLIQAGVTVLGESGAAELR